MLNFFRPAIAILAITMLSSCEDENNRVLSQHVSPEGHEFTLLPITERGVTDITIAAAWSYDWILSGDKNEWVPGLATELMLTGGTSELSPADVLDLFEEKSTWGDIYVGTDYIYGELEFPNNHSADVLPVLAEMFQRPNFDQAWFDRIKTKSLESRQSSEKSDGSLMWDATRIALFGDRPQTRFHNGTDLDRLKSTTLEELKAWHQASFAHRPSVIVVSGAINPTDAGKAIDQLFPAPGAVPVETKGLLPEPRVEPKSVFLHRPSAEKSTLAVLGALPPVTEKHGATDTLLINLLANGAESPLFEAVRTELGATYSVNAELAAYSRSQRALAIYSEVEADKMEAAVDAILDTYADFKANVDTSKLDQTRAFIADEVRQEQVYVSDSAFILREILLQQRPPEDYQTLPDDVEGLGPEDLQARLDAAFPEADAFMVFAVGPDPSTLPGACVIKNPIEVLEC